MDLYKEIGTRPEVYFLMVRYANKDYLSCQDLRLFLETEQGVSGHPDSQRDVWRSGEGAER